MSADTSNVAPNALPVIQEAIPGELLARPQWVAWEWKWVGGRFTKVPRNPVTGRHASANDPATWATFDAAFAFAQCQRLPGVGFVVTEDDPYIGIDLDKCRNPDSGAIAPWAAAIINRFNTYTEITPSGCGVRLWITTRDGVLPSGAHGRRKGPIEIYGAGRYFTVTGQQLRGGGQ